MRKRTILFLLIGLLALSSAAFAANWKLVYRGDDPAMGMITVYIDSDSIVRNGDHLTYWTLSVYDLPFLDIKKMKCHHEVTLSNPRQMRDLGCISYDSNDHETGGRGSTVTEWQPVDEPQEIKEIEFALRYAK